MNDFELCLDNDMIKEARIANRQNHRPGVSPPSGIDMVSGLTPHHTGVASTVNTGTGSVPARIGSQGYGPLGDACLYANEPSGGTRPDQIITNIHCDPAPLQPFRSEGGAHTY